MKIYTLTLKYLLIYIFIGMTWCPKIYIMVYISILKIMRFGNVDLSGKLNYADLWHTYIPHPIPIRGGGVVNQDITEGGRENKLF